MIELTLAVLAVLVASAIFSGAEAALFSLPLPKAQQMAESSANGRVLLSLKTALARPIATIVIGNNLVNIVGTFYVAQLSQEALAASPWARAAFPFVLTLAVILFSEILPKNVGERYSTSLGGFIARPLSWLTWFAYPAVMLIESVTSWLIPRPTGMTTTNEEEIKMLARIGHQEGVIERDEHQMIERVFRLNDSRAIDIMTPRTAFTMVEGGLPIAEAKKEIARSPHSRILVIHEEPDDLYGVVLKSRVLRHLVDGADEAQPIRTLAEPAQFVYESFAADKLLVMFQKTHKHLAVVLDEYGGVSGLVTLEDVLEVLTGEIVDETDVYVDMQLEARRLGRQRIESMWADRARKEEGEPREADADDKHHDGETSQQ